MKVYLLSPDNNKREKEFAQDLVHKIRAVGYSVVNNNSDFKSMLDSDALVLIFDGRDLPKSAYIKLGMYYNQKENEGKKKFIVGYNTSESKIGEEKDFLGHVAKTELNLISCLKDYIYYNNKHEREDN